MGSEAVIPLNGDSGKRHVDPVWLNEHKFKPGKSGNPAGRPKDVKFLSEHLRDRLKDRADTFDYVAKFAKAMGMDPKRVTIAEVIIGRMIQQALTAKIPAWHQEMFDRMEGKAQQEIKIDTATPNGNVNLKVLSEDELRQLGQTLDRISGPSDGLPEVSQSGSSDTPTP